METSIVDLGRKSNEILHALDRNEIVTVIYRGKIKGVIKPIHEKTRPGIKSHPFFGMHKNMKRNVSNELNDLRKLRYDL